MPHWLMLVRLGTRCVLDVKYGLSVALGCSNYPFQLRYRRSILVWSFMQNIDIFKGSLKKIRTVVDDSGRVLYVRKDVTKALGYRGSATVSKTFINEDQRLEAVITDTRGREQTVAVLSYKQVLTILLKSRLVDDKYLNTFLETISNSFDVMKALMEFEIPDDLPEMFLYAIRNTVTGSIKIGITREPESRLKTLQEGNEQKLELVYAKKAKARYSEKLRLHAELEPRKVRGDWFMSVDVLAARTPKD